MAFGNLTKTIGHFMLRNEVGFVTPAILLRYAEKTHLKKLFGNLGINCLIDVGSNKGLYSKSMRKIGYSGDIFSFEPIKEDFEIQCELSRDDPKWRTYNVALGDRAESKILNIIRTGENDTVFSSFYELRDPAANPSTTIKEQNIVMENQNRRTVDVRRLDFYLDEIIK